MLLKRKHGEEHPYWPAGPFKIRLPFIHYRWEIPETIQALVMFVIAMGMIPLLEQYLGLPYEVALAYVVVCGIGFMLPTLLGVPFVPGWITPAIPVVLLFIGQFEPGPEAIRALVALQLMVTFIFLFMAVTRLGSKLVNNIPNSIKAGILLGAGIAAISGEISQGGRLFNTPISLTIGGLVTAYVLFSLSFRDWTEKHRWAKLVASYGMVPGMLLTMFIGWGVAEYPLPDVQWGFNVPAMGQIWAYLPFTVGFPGLDLLLLAIPTAIIAYIIAFGDIIVGQSLIKRVDHLRPDEKIEVNVDRVHLVTGIRNLLHSFFAPYPGLAGPLFTGAMATIAERYRYGRKAMDTIYSGASIFWIVGFIALFLLPLVTLFRPVLPIALSITLLITGYLCIAVAVEQIDNATSMGVAGIMGVVLATHGAAWGLGAGLVLYFMIEFRGRNKKAADDTEEPIHVEDNMPVDQELPDKT
ncbi:solute carrier family 23 protein [Marinospirillum alkaliphilum]|uniref:Sulfate permease, MFS superfamily n=1 Tax=Marinospirillum alkaliphilum DSM 21637 TaxID=1122209 RepID=A0A1K1TCY5_9GAMM|nr:solute carrier family 23 protein [Marinospirillum alkaliphilum]SFW98503.1 Sulfate permease, MFS superfamily [Marinospirillum alkaliphilum DSM 21637]